MRPVVIVTVSVAGLLLAGCGNDMGISNTAEQARQIRQNTVRSVVVVNGQRDSPHTTEQVLRCAGRQTDRAAAACRDLRQLAAMTDRQRRRLTADSTNRNKPPPRDVTITGRLDGQPFQARFSDRSRAWKQLPGVAAVFGGVHR